jgi:hypothetical protein
VKPRKILSPEQCVEIIVVEDDPPCLRDGLLGAVNQTDGVGRLAAQHEFLFPVELQRCRAQDNGRKSGELGRYSGGARLTQAHVVRQQAARMAPEMGDRLGLMRVESKLQSILSMAL